jgi:hypothetical protein
MERVNLTMIYYKKFCECHNVPPSTIIIKTKYKIKMIGGKNWIRLRTYLCLWYHVMKSTVIIMVSQPKASVKKLLRRLQKLHECQWKFLFEISLALMLAYMQRKGKLYHYVNMYSHSNMISFSPIGLKLLKCISLQNILIKSQILCQIHGKN